MLGLSESYIKSHPQVSLSACKYVLCIRMVFIGLYIYIYIYMSISENWKIYKHSFNIYINIL